MPKIIITSIILVLVVAGGVFLFRGSGSSPDGQAPEAASIFDIAFKDYEGNTVTLSEYKGTPLVINSWASWCPFCIKELPDLREAQREFGDQVKIIAINRQESLERAKTYTDDLGVTDNIVLLLDNKDVFYRKIGGFTMPETLFIDAEGNTVEQKRGVMDLEEIQSKINKLLQIGVKNN